ncbi:MAG: N-6 DNA methylase [Thermoplasmata archaeon]
MSDRKSGQTQSISAVASEAVAELSATCANVAHTGRLMAFSEFLRKVFGLEIREIAPKVERYRSLKIHTLRGRPDLPFGDVILEMKTDISRERDKALEELQIYGPLVHLERPDRTPIGLVTDGLRYEVYVFETIDGKPRVDGEGRFVVSRNPIDSFELGRLSPEEFCIKLDALMFKYRPVPTPSDLALRFGPGSPTYHTIMTGLEAAYAVATKSTATRFQQWEKNMGIVYGRSPGVKAFLGHTYLVLLSRLLIDLKINGPIKNTEDLKKSIRGERLAQYGLGGYEGGYFLWVLDASAEKLTLPLLRNLADQLSSYDFTRITGDLFRLIYQEIVTGEVRHRTGEYYTPQWLAELVVKEVLEKSDRKSVIDPACGSGTFLAAAIEVLRKKGYHLQDILRQVVGIDINPMAVEIARATYLLALGRLLNERVSEIDLPVYVADSLRLPKPEKVIETQIPVFRFEVYGKTIALPESIAGDEEVLLSILRMFLSIMDSYERGKINRNEAVNTLAAKVLHMYSKRKSIREEWAVLEQTLSVLIDLADRRLDSIWVFLLRNLYAPARLSRVRFDAVIGNPPWISLRYIIDDSYQDFIKTRMRERGLLDTTRPQLVTQMEIATLFYVESALNYLKKDGVIAFVMPRSVLTGSQQHKLFQRTKTPAFKLIFDFEGVSPIFNVPCCVVFGSNKGKTKFPVKMTAFEGKLPGKDCVLSEVADILVKTNGSWDPAGHALPEESSSYYRERFRQGATIVPRCFWFVDFRPHPALGIDPSAPLVKTSAEAERSGKKPWKTIRLEGKVESKYLYVTLLAKDISSFAHLEVKPVVLPVAVDSAGRLRMLDVHDLRALGDSQMQDWLETCERYWRANATKKSIKSFPSVTRRLDYQRELTSQTLERYAVLYPASGTHLAACVLDTHSLPPFKVDGQRISPRGFVADAKTYIYRTESKAEAMYLVGILNSKVLNDAIKLTQSRGTFGPRDIHKRPLDFAIPRYDGGKGSHRRVAEIAESAVKHAQDAVRSGLRGRKKFRDSLPGIDELDMLVRSLVRID